MSHFHTFCDSEQIPRCFHLPASEDLLCAFASSCVGSIAGFTAKSQIAALKAWHIYNNAPWLGSARLCYVLHSMENLTPAQSRRPPRPPITRRMLVLLASHLFPSDSFDTCCLVAACCAMWAQLRLSEILSQWECSFTPSKVVCGHHLAPSFNVNLPHLPPSFHQGGKIQR